MKRSRHHGGDLLLGLSLAEIFMLFILLTWISSVWQSGDTAAKEQQEKPAQVTVSSDRLDSLEATSRRYAGFSRIIPPQYQEVSADSLRRVLEKGIRLVEEGGRGARACLRDNNVLFDAWVRHEVIDLTISRSMPRAALEVLDRPGGRRYFPGDTLTGDAIEELVRALQEHKRRDNCVFDYRLNYVTYKDRALGEDTFERACYLHKRQQVAE